MRKDRAKRRADELQATAEPGWLFHAFHNGRNSWSVRKRIVSEGGVYGPSEEVER